MVFTTLIQVQERIRGFGQTSNIGVSGWTGKMGLLCWHFNHHMSDQAETFHILIFARSFLLFSAFFIEDAHCSEVPQ